MVDEMVVNPTMSEKYIETMSLCSGGTFSPWVSGRFGAYQDFNGEHA
jgi:hypothetical protein